MGPDQRERKSGDHGEGARAHGTGDTGRRNGDRPAIRSFRRRRRRERGTGEPGGTTATGVPRGDVRGITGEQRGKQEAPARPVAAGDAATDGPAPSRVRST
ncbi:hypothetical protein GCM10018771_07210 [Streptomyces cellulosae]|nr:hypothetical protein GCM10018771_07210 [Streptomyces cellulosae]